MSSPPILSRYRAIQTLQYLRYDDNRLIHNKRIRIVVALNVFGSSVDIFSVKYTFKFNVRVQYE